MANEGLSRRNFLKGAGIAASGAAMFSLAACGTGGGASSGSAATPAPVTGGTTDAPAWTHEADIVIVGAGAVGLMAGIRAHDLGASVIIVEANFAAGGHAITSGGHMHLGGGHSLQKRMGIEDSADQYYLDHTVWTSPRDAFNIREVIRGAADFHAEAFEFLLENGWTHLPDDTLRGQGSVDSVNRTITSDRKPWEQYDILGPGGRPNGGLGLTRPLEKSARDKGVQFMMNHHMDQIYRDAATGNVIGIQASYTPRIMPGQTEPLVDFEDFLHGNIESTETAEVKANKAVVIATGGSSSNWEFHSLFDPRYGPEHAAGVGGDPFSFQDASGEIAAMKIGATLGATEVGIDRAKARAIGTQYGYRQRTVGNESPIFPIIRSYGFDVDTDRNAQIGLIYVNMLGNRFSAEDADEVEYFERLMGSAVVNLNGEITRLAGPIWAIFDDKWAQDGTTKEAVWDMSGPPSVDWEDGFIFKADTIEDLASQIVNKFYEDIKMDPATLKATVDRYNGFVDSGVDEDFGRELAMQKIETPPFYAAWCPNAYHDTIIGLLINRKFQVMDVDRQVIPHLYCGGEASAGQGMHGHGKNMSNGLAIGTHVVEEPSI